LERAQEEAELAMDILRYALASLEGFNKKYAIGIEGEVRKTISRYPLIIPADSSGDVSSIEVKSTSNIVINLEKSLEDSGANEIVSILNKGSAISDFEAAILQFFVRFIGSHLQKSSQEMKINFWLL
jgi:hypothetical protein